MFEYFPDNYTWTLATMICLNSGGRIAEVDEACRPLKEIAKRGEAPEALEQWYQSWKRVAERVEQLAVHDEESGHPLSAGRKYLRASLYYIAAERLMTNLDSRKVQVYKQVLSAFKKGVQLRREPVEFVEVPFQGSSLPSLFFPGIGDGRRPCMVHFGGFDSLKEILYTRIGHEFRLRGISLLIVDHPGVGEALRLRNLYSAPNTEVPAAACVDYLETHPDVDPDRIGIMALSLGGYYAPRAAAFEKRFKCCVAWGAMWDFNKMGRKRSIVEEDEYASVPSFQATWVFGKNTPEEALEVMKELTLEEVIDKVTCPLLVVHGENDRQVPLWQAEKTIEAAVNSPGRKLKVFTLAEGGAEHCGTDNSAMQVDYMADWVAEILGGDPKGV
ncbi:MAG: alpha/beta hydrolase [Dehalococcoidia bacterium]|nr:MAG: alpha/beta hydrolase [Dehalococcoidia bacterium]